MLTGSRSLSRYRNPFPILFSMFANRSIVALVCRVMLGGCGGGDRAEPEEAADGTATETETASIPDSPGPGFEIVDAGAEPRVQLQISEHGTTTLDVSVVSRSEVRVGDELIEDTQFATYGLQIDLSPSETDQLLARFSAIEITTTPDLGDDDPGVWEWKLADDGTLISATPPALPPDSRLSEMLSTYGLVLMVPPEPIGDRSGWTYLAPGSSAPIEIGISRISENEIEATMSSRHDTAGATVSLTASGRWDRRTLLPVEAVSNIEMTIESTTTRNGEVIPVSMEKRVQFQYGVGE